jgi:Mrp family chromosome partitioning ATPase
LKKQASSSNGQDVQLRALEREAKAQRDLLETYLAKYREANTRENIDAAPADGRIISSATVSNTPAYPKKLPIVLIATLATLMLSSGAIATGELLRMTAPTVVAASASLPNQIRGRPVLPANAVASEVTAHPADAAPDPEPSSEAPLAPAAEPQREVTSDFKELEQLADLLQRDDESARKVTVLGTAAGETVTRTALSLARLLARHARVVVVDLAAATPTIAAASVDPTAPGLAELMLGEASFSDVITRDRQSRAQLVSAGRPGSDRTLLQSPRLALAVDALMRVYDHVVLDAGNAADLPAELLTAQARAVVVPAITMSVEARAQMCEQLKAAGFSEVTMLMNLLPSAIERGPRVEAA